MTESEATEAYGMSVVIEVGDTIETEVSLKRLKEEFRGESYNWEIPEENRLMKGRILCTVVKVIPVEKSGRMTFSIETDKVSGVISSCHYSYRPRLDEVIARRERVFAHILRMKDQDSEVFLD